MNTIAPPPQGLRVAARRRAGAFVVGLTGGIVLNAIFGYTAFSMMTRQTKFQPWDRTQADRDLPVLQTMNPDANPPLCIDHAVRTVPLSALRTQDQAELTRAFCRGVWSGGGYRVQRKMHEWSSRTLPGRHDHLWDRDQLAKSNYDVGTRITDHFEVVDRADDKVGARPPLDIGFCAECRPSRSWCGAATRP